MPLHHRSHADNVETMAQLIAGLLPPLALEARISGGNPIGDQLVTQLGLSVQAAQHVDMAILARTSGTAFVVGIGSFMAYKLFCRLAKSNCLWSSIEQLIQQQRAALVSSSTVDDPSSSPSRTVQLADGFYAVRLGGEHELLRKLDECFCRKASGSGSSSAAAADDDDVGTARSDEELAVVQIRHGRKLRRLIRQNQRVQREGIEALQQDEHNETHGILLRTEQRQRPRRDDDEESVISDISNLTSASRIPPNPEAVDRVPPLQLPPDNEEEERRRASVAASSSSASSTPMSALLHCPNTADELCWENEFSSASEAGDELLDMRATDMDQMGDAEGLFLFRERCTSLGSLSQLSAMKNLERMFRGLPADWDGDGGDTNLMQCHGTDQQQQQQHRHVDNALDNLRELDRLDANTNVSSSMLSSGRLARRCWLDMEGAAGARGLGSSAYKIAGSKSDLDFSEMSSSICSRSQLVSAAVHQQQQQHKSHGLWELTSLNFLSSSTPVPVVAADDDEQLKKGGGGGSKRIYSRFMHEKHTTKAAAAVNETETDDEAKNGEEYAEEDMMEQYQQQQQRYQKQSSSSLLLLTPMSAVAATTPASASNSSSTMVDSVISCHSSTSAFSTMQRSSNGAEIGTEHHDSSSRGVMFDSAIVSDGGAQSILGFDCHDKHDEGEAEEYVDHEMDGASSTQDILNCILKKR